MATVTIDATVSSPEGRKVLFCTVTGTSNYNRVTGDLIRAGTEVNAVNAIVNVIPSGANGYSAQWDNAANALKYFGVANGAGAGQDAANNGQPMLAMGNVVNCALIKFPCVIVGTMQ